jgi:multimeric flavodoxin WrbA
MNILILNGADGGVRGGACRKLKEAALAEAAARGFEATVFDLAAMAIKPCRGCFGCWVKHPGRCAIEDDAADILKAMASAEVRLMLTPITFGGYGSALKKALDRSIPILLPFFIKVGDEVHHPQRYAGRRRVLTVGTLPAPDAEAERIFRLLVERNALNMASLGSEARVFFEGGGDEEARRLIREILPPAEVVS